MMLSTDENALSGSPPGALGDGPLAAIRVGADAPVGAPAAGSAAAAGGCGCVVVVGALPVPLNALTRPLMPDRIPGRAVSRAPKPPRTVASACGSMGSMTADQS